MQLCFIGHHIIVSNLARSAGGNSLPLVSFTFFICMRLRCRSSSLSSLVFPPSVVVDSHPSPALAEEDPPSAF